MCFSDHIAFSFKLYQTTMLQYIELSSALRFLIWDTVFSKQLVIKLYCNNAIWIYIFSIFCLSLCLFSPRYCIDKCLILHLMMSNKMSLSVFGLSWTVSCIDSLALRMYYVSFNNVLSNLQYPGLSALPSM